MHALHVRLPKNFVLEDRIERYADAIELEPARLAGTWAQACSPIGTTPFREVRLDLGCGKGAFLVESAKREPDVLFVGIDNEPICVVYAAQAICEQGLANAVMVPGTADRILDYFAPGELARIHVNFPTPFPRAKYAHERLTFYNHLVDYRQVLSDRGDLIFKTDSLPLYRWSLKQFAWEPVPFGLDWTSEDVRGDHPGDPRTGYEDKLTAQGATVYGLRGLPNPDFCLAADARLNSPRDLPFSQSLQDYLPDDLNNMGYVPHGMQGTVVNIRNRRAKARS